jgi:hypothetical protein
LRMQMRRSALQILCDCKSFVLSSTLGPNFSALVSKLTSVIRCTQILNAIQTIFLKVVSHPCKSVIKLGKMLEKNGRIRVAVREIRQSCDIDVLTALVLLD